jgi:hypothetical protein
MSGTLIGCPHARHSSACGLTLLPEIVAFRLWGVRLNGWEQLSEEAYILGSTNGRVLSVTRATSRVRGRKQNFERANRNVSPSKPRRYEAMSSAFRCTAQPPRDALLKRLGFGDQAPTQGTFTGIDRPDDPYANDSWTVFSKAERVNGFSSSAMPLLRISRSAISSPV